jgi:hypothetical protein
LYRRVVVDVDTVQNAKTFAPRRTRRNFRRMSTSSGDVHQIWCLSYDSDDKAGQQVWASTRQVTGTYRSEIQARAMLSDRRACMRPVRLVGQRSQRVSDSLSILGLFKCRSDRTARVYDGAASGSCKDLGGYDGTLATKLTVETCRKHEQVPGSQSLAISNQK